MRRFLAPPAIAGLKPGPPPTFSVIVAAYQVADVIGEALDSLGRQTLAPLEVIVCDDGSTDDLAKALKPYQDEITFLRQEHAGEAAAKNAAAAAAKGDYVVILDADDVYYPDRLAALSELARLRPDLDILTTDGMLVANDIPVRHVYDRTWRFEIDNQRQGILQRNFIFGLAAVRRERLLEHGGFDASILWTADWDLWVRLILGGASAGCVDEPLASYRLRETSLTSRRRDLLIGKLATLEKARRNPQLRECEQHVLEASLASYGRDLDLLDLRAAVTAGHADAKRRAFELLRAPGLGPRRRLELAAIATVPRVVGRAFRRRDADTWEGAGGIRVRRPGTGSPPRR